MSHARLALIEQLATIATEREARVEVLVKVDHLPIHAFHFGTSDLATPLLLVVGGVHGLERVGTDVAIAYLATLITRLAWDELLRDALTRCRIIVVPLLNPVGMMRGWRANGNGIDLMRNAPAPEQPATFFVGGQRWSPKLPWFMGLEGAAMEPEARALVSLVEKVAFGSPCAIAIDLHSGFGVIDRVWFPYARSLDPPPDLARILRLGTLIDTTLPHHGYRFEQTARVYTIRGDLWDHLYDRRRAMGEGALLPLTLEMGSWAWVRKNPWQGLSTLGRFNPVKPHRLARTQRRHIPLLELLFHAAASHRTWL